MRLRLRRPARVLALVLATIGVLLSTTVPASAATSHQYLRTMAEVWYSAGDNDMTHGSNSFTIKDLTCDSYIIMVRYSWSGGSGSLPGTCTGEGSHASIAPLGPNSHPLTWQTCWANLRNQPAPIVHCVSPVEDVVLTN